MFEPIQKPGKAAAKRNRASSEYKQRKAAFLALHEQWPPGWWICMICGKWTQEPELDHIDRTGMGGNPELLMDEANWQLLCRKCHDEKDGGMKHTTTE